jgi:hypothetical protein
VPASKRKRLRRARDRRRERASLYAHLRAGNVTLYELLEAPPECVGNARVCDVLRHAKGLGVKGVDKVLRDTEIWPLTKMKDLTAIDRAELASQLPDRVLKEPLSESLPSNVKWAHSRVN